MKVGNVEVYRLDKFNWTYRIYTKNTSRLAKDEYSWKESKKYFANSKKAIEWAAQALVDEVMAHAADLEEAKAGLAELSSSIDSLISLV